MRLFKILTTLSCILLCLSCTTSNTIAQNNIPSDNTSTQAQLDQILAPIALYPDTLLSHILIAATYPLEVIEAQRWSNANGRPSGDEALSSVDNESWDPSVKALIAFPQILDKMSQDLRWTQDLGNAFLDDEALVLARVQTLRQHAQEAGSLDDLEYAEVSQDEAENIVIESRVREVVYVPHYDTRVVYGRWWWHDYPPIYWAVTPGVSFYWGPRIRISSGFYFSAFNWHSRNIVVVNHHRGYGNFNSGRQVVRHVDARRWIHNPSHRRNVHYSNTRVKAKYQDRYRSEQRSQARRNEVKAISTKRQSRSEENRQRQTNKNTRSDNQRRDQSSTSRSRSEQGSTDKTQRAQSHSNDYSSNKNTAGSKWQRSEQKSTNKSKSEQRSSGQRRTQIQQQGKRSQRSSNNTNSSRSSSGKRQSREDSK